MKLHNLLPKKCIIFIEGDRDKKSIIDYMLSVLYDNSNLKNEDVKYDDILNELLKREKEQSTGLGMGFAFPHARIESLKGNYMLIGISKKGLEFDSLDGEKVKFFIVSIVPKLNPAILLKSRAGILKVLNDKTNQEKILGFEKCDDIWNLVKDLNVEINHEIIAKDIMKPQIAFISPEMTLHEAARELHRFHVDSLPVISKDSIFMGELSCHDLFAYKLPDFFSSLKSISFIKNMNPFEKYFESGTVASVESIELKGKDLSICPNATIMEIIFEMTVMNKEVLYVVEEGKILGTIDRYSIIDKILISNYAGAEK